MDDEYMLHLIKHTTSIIDEMFKTRVLINKYKKVYRQKNAQNLVASARMITKSLGRKTDAN